VRNAIKKSGIPRNQIFVTSKLWNRRHHPDDIGLALQETLDYLGLDYLDLFLMHSAVAFQHVDDPFPTDKDGNIITADIDYIHVNIEPPFESYISNELIDIQSYGRPHHLRKDQSNGGFQLLSQKNGTPTCKFRHRSSSSPTRASLMAPAT
jgi:hypothetical protein